MMVLVMGGSGSGKSAWAEGEIQRSGLTKRYYIATMRAFDPESQKRIARHRAQRASLGFETLEQPQNLGELRLEGPCAALVEDLPNLLANEMFGGGDPGRILPGLESLARQCALLVVVTGSVFSDGVDYGETTQAYMRWLADIGNRLARQADRVVEVVYSIPVPVKGGDRG